MAGHLLSDAGLQVMVPPLHRIDELVADRPAECRELAWKGATFAHFNRIDKSDIVFIVNPNGYIGPSTTLDTTDVERACKELTRILKGTVVA